MLTSLLAIVLQICLVAADDDDDILLTDDPYLQYRPAFARSLPVQILLTGVVLTLVAVLFIHLIFTAQYHWPLAPVNCVLQISAVTTLLISLIATLHVVLGATINESQQWPYMLSYIAISVPPLDPEGIVGWSVAGRATWLIMNATTSGLIQITHIQFLTLLYPSRLEGRLIFSLLGPLAIVAAIMQLIPIQSNANVNNVATAVRNVCNAALSLLFTASLFLWGVVVNRKEAWRTDGGTAAFGAGALTLAVCSTGLNFLYIPRAEEYVWLQGLIWAVINWQSWVGFWWWIGGSGSDSEELKRREKHERKRRLAHEKRKEKKEQAKKVLREVFSRTSRSLSPPPPAVASNTGVSIPSTSTTSLDGTEITKSTLPRFLPKAIHQLYTNLRHAHNTAARMQAAERSNRKRELEREGISDSGWGLGSFGLRNSGVPWQDFEMSQLSDTGSREMNHVMTTHEPGQKPSNESSEEEDFVEDVAMQPPPPKKNATRVRPKSMWWFGPLERWRMKDSTIY